MEYVIDLEEIVDQVFMLTVTRPTGGRHELPRGYSLHSEMLAQVVRHTSKHKESHTQSRIRLLPDCPIVMDGNGWQCFDAPFIQSQPNRILFDAIDLAERYRDIFFSP